jgi:RHS repeat-associated protein
MRKVFVYIAIITGWMFLGLSGFGQTISGNTQVSGGLLYNYSVSTTCGASSTTIFCWSISVGSTHASVSSTSCSGGGGGGDAIIRPGGGGAQPLVGGGGCGQCGYATISFGSVTTATSITIKVVDNCNETITKNVTIEPPVSLGALASSQSINYNTAPTPLSIIAGGGNGTYSYLWQLSSDNVNWINISGAGSSTYSPGVLTASTYYRVIVGSVDYSQTSNSVLITVLPVPGTISTNTPQVVAGTTVTFSSTGATGGSCAPNYTYTWQVLSGSSWVTAGGSGGATNFTTSTLSAGSYTYHQAAACGSTTVYSNQVSITVYPPITPGVLSPGTASILYFTSPGLLSSTAPSGGNGTITYQFQSSTDNVNWSSISSGSLTYTPGRLTSNTYYRVLFTSLGTSTPGNTCAVTLYQMLPGSVNTPTTQTQPSAGTVPVDALPPGYTSSSMINFVRTCEAQGPFTSEAFVDSPQRTASQVKQTTQYLDGLGRPVETVVKGMSPLGYDMITPNIYDLFGRESSTYLPYTSAGTDGNFRNNPWQEDSSFSVRLNPGEQYFYNKQYFENSDLNRVAVQFSVGDSWVGNALGISTGYLLNTSADSVVIWNVSFSGDSTPISAGYYAAGELSKKVTIDERGYQVVEYKDKLNHLILKKTQAQTLTTSGYTGWLSTYYIYDDLLNLRYVIQPSGVLQLLAAGWHFDSPMWGSSTIARQQTFCYQYDEKARMIVKRIPGTGTDWMVYDIRNRLVMSQDSVSRSNNRWLYTQYDALNRANLAGIWTISGDRNYFEWQAGSVYNYPSPSSGNSVLTQTFYDTYNWVASSGSGLSSTFINTYANNPNYFYAQDNNNFPYPRALVNGGLTTGQVTGKATNIVGTNTYLYEVNFYDDHYRIIQKQSTNFSGGKDTTTNQYDFTGRILRVLEDNGKNGVNSLSYSSLTKSFYDPAGRVHGISCKIGNSAEDSVTVNQYDELGRLSLKKLGQSRVSLVNWSYTSSPLDTLRYSYNIRGWTSGINKDYANAVNGAANWFGMELDYDYGFTMPELSGSIAGTKWRNGGDGAQRAYGFAYDGADRLLKADFSQNSTSGWNTSAGVDFGMRSLFYDANGNILSLTQKGLKLNSSQIIDSLTYGYNTSSNQLNYVTDHANDTSAHLGDFTEVNNNSSPDYAYDGNGNLTIDNNKAISNIHYNFLNLPDSITFTGKGYIKYIYTADGLRVQKITIDNTVNKKTATTYLGSFIYQYTASPSSGAGADTLQFILQPEGRIRPQTVGKSDTVNYDFFEKDHLGDTRVVLTDQKEQDTYPAATLENNSQAFVTEEAYYTINTADTMSVSRIPSWSATSGNNYQNNNGNPPYNNDPYANTSATSAVVYHLNGATGDKSGLGITLKVMAGDQVSIYAKSFWHNGTGSNPVNNYLLSGVLNSFISSFAGTSVVQQVHGATASALEGSTLTNTGVSSWLQNGVPNPSQTTVPRAYVNWILFNDQFVPVASNCGFDLVSVSPDAVKSHTPVVNIGTSGYLYVYCSNESNVDVYFDNLQVMQTRGPLLETTDYYPSGLTMAGISDKALKAYYPKNKYGFTGVELQNQEFANGSGLEEYEFGARFYDVQLGRWQAVDPQADKSVTESPYSYAGNNSEANTDIGGNFKFSAKMEKYIKEKYPLAYQYIKYGIKDLLKSDRIVAAYAKFGSMNREELEKEFTYGSGAEIILKNMGGFTIARAVPEKSSHPIEVDERIFKLLQDAGKDDKEAALFYVVITLLHEEAHRGNEMHTIDEPNVTTSEDGYALVQDVYGGSAQMDLFGWNFHDDKDWQALAIRGAKTMLKEKKQKGETGDLPSTATWSQAHQTIRSWLWANPNITYHSD